MTVKLFLAAGALLASTSAWAQSAPAAEQSADISSASFRAIAAEWTSSKPPRTSPSRRLQARAQGCRQ